MQFSKQTKILGALYLLSTIWWLVMTVITRHQSSLAGNIYGTFTLFVVPLIGSIFGLQKAKQLGGLHTHTGRAVGATSLGLVFWSLGTFIWAIYVFGFNIEVPYPSLTDIGYAPSWLLWAYGAWQLLRATGAPLWPKSWSTKIILATIPLAVAAFSYYVVVEVIHGGVFVSSDSLPKIFFDYYYPLGDIVVLSLMLVTFHLSRRYLGAQFEIVIFILLLGHLMNYITDLAFSYTTTYETYFNGHFVDLFFSTTMFFIAVGIMNLDQGLGASAFARSEASSEFQRYVRRVLTSMQDTRLALEEICRALGKRLKVGSVSVYLRNEQTLDFELLFGLTDVPKIIVRQDPLIHALAVSASVMLWEQLMAEQRQTPSQGRQQSLQEVLDSIQEKRFWIIAPLPQDHDFPALLTVGPKLLADSFTKADLTLLTDTLEEIEDLVLNKYHYEAAMARVVGEVESGKGKI